ncbi:hypothetical protein BHE74_00024253, partial [Ensete ventricosum]
QSKRPDQIPGQVGSKLGRALPGSKHTLRGNLHPVHDRMESITEDVAHLKFVQVLLVMNHSQLSKKRLLSLIKNQVHGWTETKNNT